MEFAHITPEGYLDIMNGRKVQMSLAHLIGRYEKYSKYYKRQSEEGNFIIMDNGVIEGDQQPLEVLVKKAKFIGASELVVPDAFLDCDKTLEMASECIPYLREHLPGVKLQVVPHGNTIKEWLTCAQHLISMDIDTIGVPKVLTKIGGRDARLEVLQTLGKSTRGLDIHMLGCWNNPLEAVILQEAGEAGEIPKVRSMDSAIAYVYAREGWRIDSGERPSGEINFKDKKTDRGILENNIRLIDEALERNVNNKNITYVNF